MNRLRQTLHAMVSRRRDRGAVAVFIAIAITLVLAGAGLAVDTANLTLERQKLQDSLDSAAQIGAGSLPTSPAEAAQAASGYLLAVEPAATITVSLWCVTAAATDPATGSTVAHPMASQCNPGTSGPFENGVDGTVCTNTVCAIPCPDTGTCNAISLTADLAVAYYFAPALGIPTGNTGTVTSTSCAEPCGQSTATRVGNTRFITLPA